MTRLLRATLAVAAKDARLRLRDRSAFVVGLAAPFALATIFSLLFGEIDLDAHYFVADEDGGPAATAFVEQVLRPLEADGSAEITVVDSPDDARQRVIDLKGDAAFLIPPGFSLALASGEPTGIDVALASTNTYETLLAPALATSFVDRALTDRLARAAATSLGDPTPASVAAAEPPAAIVDAPVELRQIPQQTWYVAGMGIFFLLFTVQFAFLSLHVERADGTLARTLAAPIPADAILAGKALVGLFLGCVTMAALIVASVLLFDASWGVPAGVALMVVAAVVAALGVMAAVSSLVGSYEQANGLGMIVAVVLGMIGGSFFPVYLGPPLLAKLSLFTPHYWWFRGLAELAPSDAAFADALPAAAVLFATGAVTFAFALLRARRTLVR